jgi:hypothetical protein
VTVTATASGGVAGTARVTVTPPVPVVDSSVVSVAVIPGQIRLTTAQTFGLRAVARDARGKTVRRRVQWASSDPTVAAVSTHGQLTGVAPGTASITATTDGVRSAAATVTVVLAGPPQPGILEMAIMPWSYVSINGLPRGQRTRGVDTLPSGVAHRLHLERDGFLTFDTTVTLRPGQRLRLIHQMRPRTP